MNGGVTTNVWLWVGFHIFLFTVLALDLGVFHRKAHAVRIREALIWSVVWTVVALLFNLGVYIFAGTKPAVQWFTAYLIERSLSFDNLFVFLMIFTYFKVPPQWQHRVLFWGILGALVTRLSFILAGAALLRHFDWLFYVFGAFLVVTAVRMVFKRDQGFDPERSLVFRLFHPIMAERTYTSGKFFVRVGRQLKITPLFMVLLMIESTDIVFAVDSVPAVLAISLDTFIVYTSNALAILGLRALYFALGGLMDMFEYLHYGVAAILAFVGAKMIVADFVHVSTGWSLLVITVLLAASIAVSIAIPQKDKKGDAP